MTGIQMPFPVITQNKPYFEERVMNIVSCRKERFASLLHHRTTLYTVRDECEYGECYRLYVRDVYGNEYHLFDTDQSAPMIFRSIRSLVRFLCGYGVSEVVVPMADHVAATSLAAFQNHYRRAG